MLPQSPASVDVPPASEAADLSGRRLNRLLAAFFVFALGVVAILSAPMFMRQSKIDEMPEEVSNVRQIGLALFEFEQEYGSLPDASTANRVREKTGSTLSMGAISSNAYFRQLFAAGITSSETMFFTRNSGGHKKPDNIFATGEALKKGECQFTYFIGAVPTDNPDRPVVVAPMIPGTDRFDLKLFKGRAVILKRDNSATSMPIDEHGHVIYRGRNLMDPAHPVWDGHPPTIAWPE